MKIALVLVVGCLAVVAVSAGEGEKYTAKWDNIDIDEILHNDRLLKNYSNCLLDKGKCTSDGEELKGIIPDALETDCAKCSEKHKEAARKVINYLREHKAEVWSDLKAKYDPENKYEARHPELQS